MSVSKSKQEEARKILDDLDFLSPASSGTAGDAPSKGTQRQDPAEVLAFIDEITQKSSEPTRIATPPQIDRPSSRSGTPTLRKSGERVRVGGGGTPLLRASPSSASLTASAGTTAPNTSADTPTRELAKPSELDSQPQSASGWGWDSVWSTATAALQQAKSVVDEQVKNLPANEQARKVVEYAKTAQLDKIGQDFKRVGLSTLTDILNVVAPPISKHEVIKVWLSHDMKGYDGTETLVYRSLARIMEQVEGGDLIVNRGDESKPKGPPDAERDLSAVDGYATALKLAQASLDELIKANANLATPNPSALQNEITYSQVYLRVQPFHTSLKLPASDLPETGSSGAQMRLQFLIHLIDPGNRLTHTTVTQVIPATWIDMWDEAEWVEDLVAEALRLGVEVVGQDYLITRMGWNSKDKGKKAENAESESDEAVIVDEKGDS